MNAKRTMNILIGLAVILASIVGFSTVSAQISVQITNLTYGSDTWTLYNNNLVFEPGDTSATPQTLTANAQFSLLVFANETTMKSGTVANTINSGVTCVTDLLGNQSCTYSVTGSNTNMRIAVSLVRASAVPPAIGTSVGGATPVVGQYILAKADTTIWVTPSFGGRNMGTVGRYVVMPYITTAGGQFYQVDYFGSLVYVSDVTVSVPFDISQSITFGLDMIPSSGADILVPGRGIVHVNPGQAIVLASGAAVNPTPVGTSAASVQNFTCSSGRNIPIPTNGQLFMATVNGVNNINDYAVIYDPSQSGASDIPAKGWWYQPCLPGPHRQAHEVAITLQAGTYRFTGPECQAWLNWDKNHPFDQGQQLVNRANVEQLVVSATQNAGTEAWVFVRCAQSDASGFSFALR